MCTVIEILKNSLTATEKKVANVIKFRLFFIAAIVIVLVFINVAVEVHNLVAYYGLHTIALIQLMFLFFETDLADSAKKSLENYSGKILKPITRLLIKIIIECHRLKNDANSYLALTVVVVMYFELLLYSLLFQVIDATTMISVVYIFVAVNILFAAYILNEIFGDDYRIKKYLETKKGKRILVASLVFIIVSALIVPALWHPYSKAGQVIYALFGFALLLVGKSVIKSNYYPYSGNDSDLSFGWALTFAIYSFWLVWCAARFGQITIF